jgi:hypothetical protein
VDCSGDVIIHLHPDVLRAMNIGLGDSLSIELADTLLKIGVHCAQLENPQEKNMSTPYERTQAVLHTRDFLFKLSGDRSLPEKVRHEAKFLLRHYPLKINLQQAGLLEEDPERFGPLISPVFSSYAEI